MTVTFTTLRKPSIPNGSLPNQGEEHGDHKNARSDSHGDVGIRVIGAGRLDCHCGRGDAPPVNSVDDAVSVQNAQADEYGTEGLSDCTFILESAGYDLTPVRITACLGPAISGTPASIGTCIAVLVATGVVTAVAAGACVAAIA